MRHSVLKPLLMLMVVLALTKIVGCAATTERPPETMGEWMKLDQVKP